jgi:hypothetical protein
MPQLSEKMNKEIAKAVSHYWITRLSQREKQKKRGFNDAGLRSAVTGGAQMDEFINLFINLIMEPVSERNTFFTKNTWNYLAFFVPPKNGICSWLKMVN